MKAPTGLIPRILLTALVLFGVIGSACSSSAKVGLAETDASGPQGTLCVNVSDPDQEICDGTSVNVGGQDLELDGPTNDSVSLIASASDPQSGVRSISIHTQNFVITCGNTQQTIDLVPTISSDSGSYSTGDEVPLSRSVYKIWEPSCSNGSNPGYRVDFFIRAENYLGVMIQSQLISVTPG